MTMMDLSPVVVFLKSKWSKETLFKEISWPSLSGGMIRWLQKSPNSGFLNSEFVKAPNYKEASQQKKTMKYLFPVLCECPTELIAMLYYLVWTRHRDNIQTMDKIPASWRLHMLGWTTMWLKRPCVPLHISKGASRN